MQLEVGKKYITKNPMICEYVEVVGFSETSCSFIVNFHGGIYDEGIGWYRSDGKFSAPVDNDLDLVTEYQENIEFDLAETQEQLDRLGDLCNWK